LRDASEPAAHKAAVQQATADPAIP
jgi:hypothetical protein